MFLPREDLQEILDPRARLHSECKVAWIVGQEAIHPREVERDVVARRRRSDAELRAASAGNEREFFRGCKTDDVRNLRGVRGPDHDRRAQAVGLARGKLGGIGENVLAANNFFEARDAGLRGKPHASVVVETGRG